MAREEALLLWAVWKALCKQITIQNMKGCIRELEAGVVSVTDDVKQAIQAFLVPELDAIKAQIAELRGVQSQMSERLSEHARQMSERLSEQATQMNERLSEQAAQILEISRRIDTQRQELKASIQESESRLETRMDGLESRMDRLESRLESRMDRLESRLDRQDNKLDQILLLLAPQV